MWFQSRLKLCCKVVHLRSSMEAQTARKEGDIKRTKPGGTERGCQIPIIEERGETLELKLPDYTLRASPRLLDSSPCGSLKAGSRTT
ncbi:Dual Oxidase Maturation Factor 1 [Manis pentadactyla]|nr:Dual Oxidase Maturation Factor 1 [Manis pentadactyla]